MPVPSGEKGSKHQLWFAGVPESRRQPVDDGKIVLLGQTSDGMEYFAAEASLQRSAEDGAVVQVNGRLFIRGTHNTARDVGSGVGAICPGMRGVITLTL